MKLLNTILGQLGSIKIYNRDLFWALAVACALNFQSPPTENMQVCEDNHGTR